ncbi:hypothetical protein GIB67_014955 [Kingdonia uniflora]|uniref:EF-hand domain-containing protein n=1 Tax=Kingdonia uniflora TaxID=39325 RepID=A0A7J7MTB8_9MAGN|nr:hypothetical protein GIB67_014955 [Kingdonia uniflora]
MMMGLVLLAILFLVGFIKTLSHLPPNKFLVYLQTSLPSSRSTSMVSTSKKVSLSSKEKERVHETESVEMEKKSDTDEIKSVFATFDKNGDGFITRQELGESLKNIGLFSSEKEVGNMIDKLDVNGDGLIDIEEFREMYGGGGGEDGVKEVEKGDDLKEAFDVFDGDGDGLISVEELGSVLSSMGLKQGSGIEECKKMINKVDLDGDGMVNFEEFKLMMKVF